MDDIFTIEAVDSLCLRRQLLYTTRKSSKKQGIIPCVPVKKKMLPLEWCRAATPILDLLLRVFAAGRNHNIIVSVLELHVQ